MPLGDSAGLLLLHYFLIFLLLQSFNFSLAAPNSPPLKCSHSAEMKPYPTALPQAS